MTTPLEAPANSKAARCPRDPGGTNHLSRTATETTRYYLESRTLPGLLSPPPTLAVARAARAGTHPVLFPLSTHTFSLTRTAWRARDSATGWGTRAQITLVLEPGSRADTPSLPSPHSPPSVLTLTHPLDTRARALQSLFS